MNLNDSELEQQLSALRPAAPASALEEAIGRALTARMPTAGLVPRGAPPRSWATFLRGFAWAGAGAVAAIGLIALFDREGTPAAPPEAAVAGGAPAAFEHAEATAEIVAEEDEGFVFAADRAPARQFRYTAVERHVWTNPGTGARMEIEIPREDIRLVPVAMQ